MDIIFGMLLTELRLTPKLEVAKTPLQPADEEPILLEDAAGNTYVSEETRSQAANDNAYLQDGSSPVRRDTEEVIGESWTSLLRSSPVGLAPITAHGSKYDDSHAKRTRTWPV